MNQYVTEDVSPLLPPIRGRSHLGFPASYRSPEVGADGTAIRAAVRPHRKVSGCGQLRIAPLACRLRLPDRDMGFQTGDGGHVDQCLQREQADLAAHEVGHARLRNAEEAGGLGLGLAAGLYPGLHGHHQFGARAHAGGFLRRVLDGVPDAGESLFLAHGC